MLPGQLDQGRAVGERKRSLTKGRNSGGITQHRAEFVQRVRFMRDADGLTFDVMLEAKAKDISLLKLRPDLLRYAPDVAARFGVFAAEAAALEAEEATLEADHHPVNDPDVDEGS